MKCRYCNMALAPLRSLTDGEFCCDDHRHAFNEEQAASSEVSLEPLLHGTLLALTIRLPEGISGAPPLPLWKTEPREFKPTVVKPAASLILPRTDTVKSDPPVCESLLPLRFSVTPMDLDTGLTEELPGDLEFAGIIALPQRVLEPLSIPVERELEQSTVEQPAIEHALAQTASESERAPEPIASMAEAVPSHREVANSWHWLRDAWRNAPTDLKVVTILLPVLLAVAVGPWMPKLKVHPSLP